MGASVGAAYFPEGGRDYEEHLKTADAALYHAKVKSCKVDITALNLETVAASGSLAAVRG